MANSSDGEQSIEDESSSESSELDSQSDTSVNNQTSLYDYDSYEEYYQEEVEPNFTEREPEEPVNETKVLLVKVGFYVFIIGLSITVLVLIGLVAIDVITHLLETAGEYF